MAEPVRKHDWQITARFPEGPDPEPPEEEPGITLLRWIPGWVGEFPTLRDKLIGFRGGGAGGVLISTRHAST